MFKKTSIILWLCLALPLGAWAENPPQSLGGQVSTLGIALEKANEYSFGTGGIGIIISYGTGNEGSPERIGMAFTEEIEKRGQKAKYFIHYADWPGVTMSYRIGYSSFGPWSVNDAASNIGKVVRRAEVAYKVHNQ